ncbi:twin-arginine translocation signal domain-containing protein, partial [Pseudomonas sp.]
MPCISSRRTFVKGLGAATALAGLGLWRPLAQAAEGARPGQILQGQQFALSIGQTPVNITG